MTVNALKWVSAGNFVTCRKNKFGGGKERKRASRCGTRFSPLKKIVTFKSPKPRMTSSQLLFIPFTTETLTLADPFYDKNSDLSQIIPVMISFIMSLTVDVEVHKTFFYQKASFRSQSLWTTFESYQRKSKPITKIIDKPIPSKLLRNDRSRFKDSRGFPRFRFANPMRKTPCDPLQKEKDQPTGHWIALQQFAARLSQVSHQTAQT